MSRKDSLAHYRTKRDFGKTSEPKGITAKTGGNHYLIQKHEASHLHYDFRLELDGVLKSWAVPKGPSLDPHDKRLAMEVEDHPVAYGSFEGTIPKGQYGGGTVMLWDTGTWEPIGNAREGLKKGKLTFKLHGERLKGEWTLVRFHGHEKSRNQWFLIKHRDDEVREGDNGKFVSENTTSVVSGREMDEIAEAHDNVWGRKGKTEKKTKAAVKPASSKKKSVKKSKLPDFIPPQLATLSTSAPKGDEWLHEIKFDGYRMLSFIQDRTVRMVSRNDKDWTGAFQPIADILSASSLDHTIFDGEVVAIDTEGKSNFSQLKDALSAADYSHMQYYVFDMLMHEGEDIRELPLIERKERLKKVIDALSAKAKKRIIYSEHFANQDGKFLQNACAMHLEGIVSKRKDASYLSGRSKSWLKTKCIKREEMVIGGYTLPSNGSKGIGALLLGYYDDGELTYAGRVGTGWNADTSMELRKTLDKLVTGNSPFVSVTPLGRRGAKWVKPQLVCAMEFTEWTPDGHMRHPSFQGLREDKKAKDVHRDFAVPAATAEKQAAKEVKTKAKAKTTADAVTGGVTITHPDRIIFPESHITKQQLADYYQSIAKHIMPHVKERPLSMLRCPEGIGEICFYQRHVGLGKSPYLHELDIPVKGKQQTYMMIKDEKGLLIQWGVIELHAWQCTANHTDKPDRLVFDLDPAPDVPWKRLVEGAQEVRDRMKEFGLQSFLKTTGGKGLHVVVPLTPTYGWETLKTFARAIAESMAHDNPDRYISTMSKAARKGLIFIDYLRNEITSTAVAAFSVRARPGATVSTPLDWKELAAIKPADFTIETIPARLKKQKNDPWKDFFKVKQKISAKHLKALNIKPE
jgi:bifunctional non-homologous end joining protein LigD